MIRLFHLYPIDPRNRPFSSSTFDTIQRQKLYYFWSAACVFIYLGHVSYLLSLPRFDYTYNIIFNLVLGLSHNFLWLTFAFPSSYSLFRRFASKPKSYRPAYATTAAKAVVLTTAATCLELFDFAPWHRVVDAHSLWHLATVPLAVIWYDFLILDARDAGWKGIGA